MPIFCSCLLLAALAAAGQQQAAPASTESTRHSDGGRFVVSYEPSLIPLVISRIHNWTIHVETTTGEAVTDAQISMTGGMPLHDHGLPTLPQMTRNLGNGDYLLEGVKFHMNGWWQVTVSISRNDVRDNVTFDLVL